MTNTSPAKTFIVPTFGDERLEPNERLNEGKLYLFYRDATVEQRKLLMLDANELLAMSVSAAETRENLPISDPAWKYFCREESELFNLATMIEIRQSYLHKLV